MRRWRHQNRHLRLSANNFLTTSLERARTTSDKSQIKFAKSERTGELIGFVSRHSKTRQLKGVREVCAFGNRAVVLSEEDLYTLYIPLCSGD